MDRETKRIIDFINTGYWDNPLSYPVVVRGTKFFQINTEDNTEQEVSKEEMINHVEKAEKMEEFKRLTESDTVVSSNKSRLDPVTFDNIESWQKANRIDSTINFMGNSFIQAIRNGEKSIEEVRFTIKESIKIEKLNIKKSCTKNQYKEDAKDIIIAWKLQLHKLDALELEVEKDFKDRIKNKKKPSQQDEKIDWLNLFESIDIDQPLEHKAYVVTTIEQKKNYFSDASFKLTLQYLLHFKKETYLLSNQRKLDYINSLDIVKPKTSNSESPLFNQTVFEAQNNYYEFLITYKSILENTTARKTSAQKPTKEIPTKFAELFYDAEMINPCIDILKELDPPLIDSNCNYIGKLKGVICVWVDEMERQGIVKRFSDRKILASLIPQKIKRFSIDESMFGKYQAKAEKNYRTDIKTKISKVKLSQDSQKGK